MRSRRSEGSSGSGKIRSSPPSSAVKVRDHHRSEWRTGSYRKDYLSSHLEHDRLSRRVLDVRDRRSASVGRKDFARHLDGDRGDSSRPQFRPFDDSYLRQDSASVDFHRKYYDFDVEGDLSMKRMGATDIDGIAGTGASRPGKEKFFPGNGSSGLDGHGMLHQKSMCMEDGAVQNFFTLPPSGGYGLSSKLNSSKISSGSTMLSSSAVNFDVGNHGDGELHYRNRTLLREPYEEEDGKRRLLCPRDVSYPVILPTVSRSKDFESTSSGIGRDDFLGSYRDGLNPQSDDGFGRSSGSKFANLSERYVGGQRPFHQLDGPELRSKSLKSYQLDLPSPVRDEPQDYRYHELRRRDRDNLPFLSDELYKKREQNARGDSYGREILGSAFMDSSRDRIDDPEMSRRSLRDNGLWDHHSLQRDPVASYHEVNGIPLATDQHGELFGSRSTDLKLGTELSQERNAIHFRGGYVLETDADAVDYRERLSSPLMSECDPDVMRRDMNPQGIHGRLNMEDLGVYDPSRRKTKRMHAIDEMDGHYLRSILPNNRNLSRRIFERNGGDEQSILEGRIGPSLSERLAFGQTHSRKPARLVDSSFRVSVSDDSHLSEDLPVHLQSGFIASHRNSNENFRFKKRLRLVPSDFHNLGPFGKGSGFSKPYKFHKGPIEEWHGNKDVQDRDMQEDRIPMKKKADPPEGSEEFKQLVQRAFLRFSKLLNENPAQQKQYKEQGTAGKLQCFVCGSLSKQFVDTHSLVAHAFNSLKVGLRTDHLGLHRAICVMMGWNSLIAPDTGKAYQSVPVAEALALEEDLILWPPLVIIHNCSIEEKDNAARVVVSKERMEEILREMGFAATKAKVCRGKPENHSILVVKFLPTFSGLQEADRLHKHYAENKHGRKDLAQIASKQGNNSDAETQVDKAELVLYGYMGIAGDLDKLDFETKKRCMVKSRKDIEAIADAALI